MVLDKWTSTIDEGGCVDVIYCDFQKAFDKVPHRRLLHKLERYGIKGKLLGWVRHFLLGRVQRVRVGGTTSSDREVISGIPQGSVLGPILFVSYINDLPPTASNSDLFLFADDLKLFKSIFSVTDQELLQKDLIQVKAWSDNNLLKLHPEKCVQMRIGKSKTPEKTYTLHEDTSLPPLKKSTKEKDIGVIIDSSLSFEHHMTEKINTANRNMGLIRRTFSDLSKTTFLILYKGLVRPHLEYGNQCWAPYLKKHITQIENVQRRATKLIPGLRDMSYEDRLRVLSLPTLSYRRLRGDMIEAYKILSNKYDSDVTRNLLTCNTRVSRGHNFKLSKVRPRTNIRKNSFSLRIVNEWNHLPESVVMSENVKMFESRLDKFWGDRPLKYQFLDTTEPSTSWLLEASPAYSSQ